MNPVTRPATKKRLICTHCDVVKKADQFCLTLCNTYSSWCKPCANEAKRAWWMRTHGKRKRTQ